MSVDWLEVVLVEVAGDLLAELGTLLIGGAEMKAGQTPAPMTSSTASETGRTPRGLGC